MIVATGTTIGLKATPGDGSSRPPQITFGYKRAEISIIPTKGEAVDSNSDAFSTLTAFHFETMFFGKTELDSFISTGQAAVKIQQASTFTSEIAQAALADQASYNNRAQLAAVRRITEKYRKIDDAASRKRIRERAEQLGLVGPGTSDVDFANGGALQDRAVGGKPEITQRLEELERFGQSLAK